MACWEKNVPVLNVLFLTIGILYYFEKVYSLEWHIVYNQ